MSGIITIRGNCVADVQNLESETPVASTKARKTKKKKRAASDTGDTIDTGMDCYTVVF